jgi:uncharacterized protein with HEPN domain
MSDLPQFKLRDYVLHMTQAIEQVAEYLEDVTEAQFLCTRLLQDGVVRNLEIIGEAAHLIVKKFPEFAATHTEVPWEAVYYMRNRVIHGYASIDYELVWQVAHRELPQMHLHLKKLLAALQ